MIIVWSYDDVAQIQQGYGPVWNWSTFPLDTTEIKLLAKFGTLSGVTIEFVSGLNGPGYGSLRASGDGSALSWRAPGSPTYGAAVTFGGDATRILLDGADSDKYIRVAVTHSRLARSPGVAAIRAADIWGNEIGIEDLDASEATAGKVSTQTITLENQASNTGLVDSTNWLSPQAVASGFEISHDNSNWFSPVSDAEAQATIGTRTIAASATAPLYVRRTVGAGASSEARGMASVFCSWDDGDSGRAVSEARGLYRIANAPEFRFYQTSGGAVPLPDTDTPFAVAASLPDEPAATFADGDRRFAATEFNGFIESHARQHDRIFVVGGAAAATPPAEPFDQALVDRAGGVIEITAAYTSSGEPSDLIADTWAIWFTTDGSTPDPDNDPADDTVAMVFGRDALSLLEWSAAGPYTLPAQADGVVVKVVVRARRAADGADSVNGTIITATVSTSGPAVPSGGEFGSSEVA